MGKKYFCGIFGVAILLAFDQWTKHLAALFLKGKENYHIIKDVFELEYLENHGAAFGILQNQRILLLAVTLLIFVALCIVYYRIPNRKRFLPMHAAAILIASGAIGNMLDRFIKGYVVDFFSFSLINFPIFNVADCFVVVGTISAMLLVLFYYKEEELQEIWESRKA